MSNPQPKILQRLILRTAGLLLVLAALFAGYQWFQRQKGDFDIAPANTAGMIAAVQEMDEGSRAVAFGADGKLTESAGYEPRLTERDLAWAPNGNRIYLVSDRAGAQGRTEVPTFNIFRWNPAANASPVQRTQGTRGRSNLRFPAQATPAALPLLVSGGFVLEFDDQNEGSTRQVLPPVGREVSASGEEGRGATGQFSAAYEELGNSFRVAEWCGGNRFIAAVMRQDEGEVLVLQDLQEGENGQLPPPQPVAGGERIELAVSPADGRVVYAVIGFRWPSLKAVPPEFRRNGRVLTPFRHGIGVLDPQGRLETGVVVASADDENAFASPAVAPDGERLVVVVGKASEGVVEPRGLVLMPCRPQGGSGAAPLLEGKVYEPSWHPNGQALALIRQNAEGKRAVTTVNVDGSDVKDVSGDRGDFATPLFSPQSR